MENRKKFYPDGFWGKNTLQERFQHVMGALDAYRNKIIDEQDLVFVIKNAFVSKIFISQGVACAYPAPQPLFANLSTLYDQLYHKHILDLQDNQSVLNTAYMPICELGTKVSYLKSIGKIAKALPAIRVEHVVPGNVFMDDVKKITTFAEFKEIFDAVSICLVTDSEAKLLDSNGFRSSMPKNVNYKMNPFARYKAAGVVIL